MRISTRRNYGRPLAWFVAIMLMAILAVPAWAQSEGEPAADEADQQEEIRRAVEEAADAAREALRSAPDPIQARTQASEEMLNQGTPTREEMFVYSLAPWQGMEFGATFAPTSARTIYLMEGSHSIINPQRTEVYYWPITREYMANWFEMRDPVEGRLQIEQDGKIIATLDRTQYSYYYPQGHGGPQVLKLGEEAVRTFEDYQHRLDQYFQSVTQYYEERRIWDQTMSEILKEVRETGQPKDPEEIPEPPKEPQAPTDFAYQTRESFAINLPAGRYTIKVIAPDGSVVPDSERTLVVFAPRRVGTGYDVIPEHKWTRRFQSNDPSDVFYLDGTRVFYIQPNEAREFNLYQYVKMLNLHKPLEGEGTRSAWTWAQFEPISPNAVLQVLKDGEVIREIRREPFYVQQTPGHALGYTIVPFTPEYVQFIEQRAPSFEAYRVVLDGEGGYQLRFVDEDGNVLEGSVRMVRAVKSPGTGALAGVSSIPFVVGAVVFGLRRTKARRKGPADVEA